MMRKLIITLSIALFGATGLLAQAEWGLFSQPTLWQANRLNPAFWPDQKWTISLPGIQNTLYFSGPTYGDVIREENGAKVFDVDALIDNLEPENLVREHLEISTLGLGVRLGKSFGLSFQHLVHFNAYLSYPKDLPQLAWQGNGAFVGQTMVLDHDLQLYAYNEFALGGFFGGESFQIGARAKLLTGIGDVSTERGSASLYTDTAFYQLQFLADYHLNTSSYFQYETYNDFELNYDFGQIRFDKLFTSNAGFAFDLGARLKREKWWIAGSMVDMGSIRWTEEVRNYRAEGAYNFDGLDISEALTGDSVEFGDALDTLKQLFAFKPTNEAYTTILPLKIYLSGGVNLSEKWSLGGVLFSEWYREEYFPGFSVNAGFSPAKWINLGASYAVFRNTFANIGLSAAARLGPVQIYAMADNISAVFKPADSRYFHLRAGLNLGF
ncbi:MAG: hypothetical protein IPJ00_12425 [Saprospirales bacterium]|nr:hypothetical protein [Saprospirales bacterium]